MKDILFYGGIAVDTLSSHEVLTPVFKEIETILGKDTYDMWLRPAAFQFTDKTLKIELPNPFWQPAVGRAGSCRSPTVR